MESIQIAESIAGLRYSVIREMSALAAGMPDVINLGIGEPDFATPSEVIVQALADAGQGHTHYTASQGDPELLCALAERLSNELAAKIQPDSILVTHGAMGALAASLRTLLEQGDEVLVMEPHFPDYLAHITFAGGRLVGVPTRFENGFLPDPEMIERAITPRSRVILLNSPNNPSGAVLPEELLDEIAAIAIRHNLCVLSDEVYDQILFIPEFPSIYTRPGMAERTLIIRSFSKNFAMTGWRVGYCHGPQRLVENMLKVVNYATACTSSVSQRAALAALRLNPAVFAEMTATFKKRAMCLVDRINAIEGLRVHRPQGSFYLFVDVRAVSRNSREFALDLLHEQQVVVVPGYAFGKSTEGFVRIACTSEIPRLLEAMDRIESFVRGRSSSSAT